MTRLCATLSRLCLCICLIATSAGVIAGNDDIHISQLRHRVWRLTDGLFPPILAIAEGADGYLWLGTTQGVLRFDGIRFTRWQPPSPHEPLDYSGAILKTREGAMWIAKFETVGILKGGKFTDVPLSGAAIQSLFQDHSGTVWAVRAKLRTGELPLCSVSTVPVRCYGPADGLKIKYATGIAEDADGYFWIASGLLARWKPGTAQKDYFGEALKAYGNSRAISDLATLKDGSILAGLSVPGPDAGLQILKSGQWQTFRSPDFDGGAAGGRTFLEDRDGALWISPNVNGGLVHLQHGHADTFTESDGLSSNRISRILQDREGTVWAVTAKGLDSFSRPPVVTYSTREGVPQTGAPSIVGSPEGGLLAFGRVPFLINDTGITPLPGFPDDPGRGQVYSALIDRGGTTWLGEGNHLYIYRDQKLLSVRTPTSADSLDVGEIVPALVEDPKRRIWGLITGNHRHRIISVSPQGMQEVTDLPTEDLDDSLAADLSGNLWAGGASNRLTRFSIDERKPYTETVGLSDKDFVTQQLFVDPLNRLWVISGEGVRLRSGGRWFKLDAHNGLACDALDSAILDGDQTLWIASECGLMSIRAGEWQKILTVHDAHVNVRLWGATDGFLEAHVDAANRMAQTRDGRIWFSGRDIQTFLPSALNATAPDPPVHIEGLLADGKWYAPAGSPHVPPDPHEVELDYTAPSSTNPQAIQFTYRLANYDRSWRAPDTRRQAFYTDLPPGRYRFEVALAGPQGTLPRPRDSIEFSIAPAFYQTYWFRTASALIVVLALWMAYRARLTRVTSLLRLTHRERLLERESIARDLHDTFFQSVQSIMLRVHTTTSALPEQTPVRLRLEEVLDDADQVLLEGRRLMLSLRAETSRSMTLAEALVAAGEHLKSDHPCEFKVSVIGELRPLLPLVFEEIRFFGIEAISNAFRHAQATLIEVEIHYARNEFRLRIRDDGIGINPEILGSGGRPNHWGIPGLRERSAKVGGRMEIWSRADAGTEIELRIPARAAYASGK